MIHLARLLARLDATALEADSANAAVPGDVTGDDRQAMPAPRARVALEDGSEARNAAGSAAGFQLVTVAGPRFTSRAKTTIRWAAL
jgi:hypothetical protein